MVHTPDRPQTRPYARIERERRFLVATFPEHLDPTAFERLHDLYIAGTSLRLRRIESPEGAVVQVKLGQKRPNPAEPHNATHRQMTTCYLEPAEAAVLQALPGANSTKRRYAFQEQGRTFVLDVYEAPASAVGILLAEVECDDDASLQTITLPPWAEREVTEEGAFSGARLAAGSAKV
ncbi:MAG TPA: hypothetical protein P5218_02420 [Planctomycetota bacterium]|nr:hypothetical protein [Planctomycetota bacterium]HPF13589.1 hypothetical protein [Planctomycetota bacterium]HRV80256.1 hypothetical protein [Planctomycetota bacterium]